MYYKSKYDHYSKKYDYITQENLDLYKQSLSHINQFQGHILEELQDCFCTNIFPESKRENLITLFCEILQEFYPEDQKRDLLRKSQHIYRSLLIIIDIIDKSNKGFLTGDLTSKAVVWAEKLLKNMDEKFAEEESKLNLNNRTKCKIIDEYFDELFTVVSDELFKLPKKGILHPDCENPRNLFERQLILEDESNEIAVEKFLSTYESLQSFGLAHNLNFAKSYMVKWFPQLCQAIREEQEKCLIEDQTAERAEYSPYLIRLKPEKLALIALSELMKNITKIATRYDENQSNNYFIISKLLFDSIGKSINLQIQYEVEEETINSKMKDKFAQSNDVKSKIKRSRETEILKNNLSESLLKKNPRQKQTSNLNYSLPFSVQYKLGSLLVYLMKETTKIKNSEGFWTNLITISYANQKGTYKYVGVLKINEEFITALLDQVEKKDSLFIQLDRCLPMLYKPAPWHDYEIGGYYQKPTNFMRIQNSGMQEFAIKYADLTKVYHVLNIVGEVPWKINKNVLNVIEKVWNNGGGEGEIPKRYYDYKDFVYDYQYNECKNLYEIRRLKKKIQLQRDVHSLRCDFSQKLNVAKAFSKISKFYYPHNIDFRGRMYPIPPHLNHMSADICRGMLEFGEGKRLGKSGVKWLKIHLANKMGKDKLSIDDREAYTNSIIPLVNACVADPIKNSEWLEVEDCWQTQAAMFDLHEAISQENPEDHISHLHIHQDGSCNGLQHYAALGRDYDGAYQVNLVNRDRPGDLYTHIANMVEERVGKDAEDSTSEYFEIAKKLRGNVKRKTIKQTVMTTVYGVTFIGARKQIAKQLKDKDFLDHSDDYETYTASKYLATLTLNCVADLFTRAHKIKQWLKDCAQKVVRTGHPVSFITPLGLPVVQPYRSKSQTETVKTLIQKIVVSEDPENLPVNMNKQQTAFPPNFIHSLDSTHLMYTSVSCKEKGITFAAVHDSFWTHACDVDRMNDVLRDEFIRLHNEPLLDNLKESLETRFTDIDIPDVPELGELDLNEIKGSLYFFS